MKAFEKEKLEALKLKTEFSDQPPGKARQIKAK